MMRTLNNEWIRHPKHPFTKNYLEQTLNPTWSSKTKNLEMHKSIRFMVWTEMKRMKDWADSALLLIFD